VTPSAPRWATLLALLGLPAPVLAGISADDRAAAEAFKAAVRGEREFGTDFMAHSPSADERAYRMNLSQCDASGLDEGRDKSIQIVWSCHMEGVRFQKQVVLEMAGGKIAKVGVFDCINLERRRRCN
jgi:hypothetical protein